MERSVEDVERQLQSIREEISSEPLLSHPEELSLTCRLTREFQHDDVYFGQVCSLFERGATDKESCRLYRRIRYARRDGNCFFRCASFRLFTLMLHDTAYADFCLTQVRSMERPMLSFFGEYSSDFSTVAKELIDNIKRGTVQSVDDIYAVMLSEDAGYLMVFFRYAVSMYLRQHTDAFLPFVMGLDYGTVEGYCSAEVEPVDRESDNIQLAAFAQLFHVELVVETLDRTSPATRPTVVIGAAKDEPGGTRPKHAIHLLFRPGHFDLLEV